VLASMTPTCPASPQAAVEPALNAVQAAGPRVARQGGAGQEADAGSGPRGLPLGPQALGRLVHRVGPGEGGESVVLPEGQAGHRLETPPARG
jgi:hypothetical protein